MAGAGIAAIGELDHRIEVPRKLNAKYILMRVVDAEHDAEKCVMRIGPVFGYHAEILERFRISECNGFECVPLGGGVIRMNPEDGAVFFSEESRAFPGNVHSLAVAMLARYFPNYTIRII